MRGSTDEETSVIDSQDAEIGRLKKRITKLEGEVEDATDRLLRARKVALDASAARHLVFNGWAYRMFDRIVTIIEKKENP